MEVMLLRRVAPGQPEEVMSVLKWLHLSSRDQMRSFAQRSFNAVEHLSTMLQGGEPCWGFRHSRSRL